MPAVINVNALQNPATIHRLLKTSEVADLLQLSSATLEKFRSCGTGPRWVKVGGRAVRYRPEDIEDFVLASTEE